MAIRYEIEEWQSLRKAVALWAVWLLATTTGLAAASAIAIWPIYLAPAPEELRLIWLCIGPVLAAPVTGVCQRAVLRSRTGDGRRWIALTSLAWLVAFIVLPQILHAFYIGDPRFPIDSAGLALVGGILIGTAFGMCQWVALRRAVVAAGWWILASIVGWVLCLLTIEFLAALPLPLSDGVRNLVVISAGEVLVGVTTGIALVGLFEPSVQRARNLTVLTAISLAIILGLAVPLTNAYSQQTRILRHAYGRSHVYDIAFSSDGTMLITVEVSGDTGHSQLVLWEVETGRRIRILGGSGDRVAFLPDGKVVTAEGRFACAVTVWDIASDDTLGTINLCANDVAVSPDARLLAIATGDFESGVLVLWDLTTGRMLRELQGQLAVNRAAFSPDGRLVASGSGHLLQNSLRIWDIDTGRPLLTVHGLPGLAEALAFSPDGTQLLLGLGQIQRGYAPGRTLRVWNVDSGEEETVLDITKGIADIALSPDGESLAVAYALTEDDPAIYVYSLSDGELLVSLKGHTRSITSLAFSPDGTTLASGSWDGTTRLWVVR